MSATWVSEDPSFKAKGYYDNRPANRSATTFGSARVDVSPRLESSFSAIFLRMRRMIFPDRVLGSPGAH